jgi:N-acetylmuramic acid 6-phosphate etherase
MKKTTESNSNYDGLDKMSVSELLLNINREDKTVANFVEKQLQKNRKTS